MREPSLMVHTCKCDLSKECSLRIEMAWLGLQKGICMKKWRNREDIEVLEVVKCSKCLIVWLMEGLSLRSKKRPAEWG